MIRQILQIGAPILEKKTTLVKDVKDQKVQDLIDDLLDTCKEQEKRSAGLSANQIGEDYSICICRRTDLEAEFRRDNPKDDKPAVTDNKLWEVMINPVITHESNTETVYWEGCLSIGETEKDTIYGPVWRPESVKIEYLNREGEKQKLTADDFFSHVAQHEIDHLNGKLFLALVPNPQSNLWKATDLDAYIDKKGDYPKIVE